MLASILCIGDMVTFDYAKSKSYITGRVHRVSDTAILIYNVEDDTFTPYLKVYIDHITMITPAAMPPW